MRMDRPETEVNIGLVGHVDHGKTTLTKALSGTWTDTHSMEVRRGITIHLGYADITIYKCPSCEEPMCWSTRTTCKNCNTEGEPVRTVSLVDAPGHETLMATMLSGAAIMNGALLVIAADEKCPQPQTREHLMALEIMGAKNVVIVHNKIDLVDFDRAKESREEIRRFIDGTIIEDAPIIPVSAHHDVNIDVMVQALQETIPTPERKADDDARMFVARSFDINKPGTKVTDIEGGVIGGTLSRGTLKIGDEVEILPGIKQGARKKKTYTPITTTITSLRKSDEETDTVAPGGLLAVGTELDPYFTKSNSLTGSILGKPGTLPPVYNVITFEPHLLDHFIGAEEDEISNPRLEKGGVVMLTVGTATTTGIIADVRKSSCRVNLNAPVVAEEDSRIAISLRVGKRWRLAGYGILAE